VVKIVVDSYAWIEIFLGSMRGTHAKDVLTKADEVYTPNVVLAEVARKYFREGMKESVILKRLTTITEASDVTPIDITVATEAARGFEELKRTAKRNGLREAGLFDAIVLALARVLKAKILTGDEHLKNFSETLWL